MSEREYWVNLNGVDFGQAKERLLQEIQIAKERKAYDYKRTKETLKQAQKEYDNTRKYWQAEDRKLQHRLAIMTEVEKTKPLNQGATRHYIQISQQECEFYNKGSYWSPGPKFQAYIVEVIEENMRSENTVGRLFFMNDPQKLYEKRGYDSVMGINTEDFAKVKDKTELVGVVGQLVAQYNADRIEVKKARVAIKSLEKFCKVIQK